MSFPSVVTGFHAGKRSALERAVNGMRLTWSVQRREWLGYGVYFWVWSEEHAHRWINIGYQKGIDWWSDEEPAILEAEIHLGRTLNMTEPSGFQHAATARDSLEAIARAQGWTLPKNHRFVDGVPLNRDYDCLLYNQIHANQAILGKPEFDTVIAAFEDGGLLSPGSSIRSTSHIQVAVRNHNCIKNPRIIWP